MNKVVILVIGLVIGGAIVIGGEKLLEKAGSDEMAQMKTQIAELDKKVTNATTEENKLRQKLADAEKEKTACQAQISDLQKLLAGANEQLGKSAIKPETPKDVTDKKPEEKELIKRDDLRRYAKVFIKMMELRRKSPEAMDFNEMDPELQNSMMEFFSEMMKLGTKYKINWTNPFSGYNVPELRQLFGDLTTMLFEELNVPLNDLQKAKIMEGMESSGKESEKLDDKSLSELEKYVMMHRMSEQYRKEFQDMLTDEQRQKVPDLSVFGNIGGGFSSSSISSSETDKANAVNSVLGTWSGALKLEDAEKQSLKPVADRYISDYINLKKSLETEQSKEFMDYYLNRTPPDEAGRKAFEGKRTEYIKNNPDFTSKKGAIDLQFLEVQLKYQKELKSLLPAKEELIKKQQPTLYYFPNLE